MLKIAPLISLFLYVWSAQSWFWIHWENNYALSQQGANGPVWICPKWTGAAYWSGRKGFFFVDKGRRNTYNKGTHSTYFGAACCFLSECIGVLHHLHLLRQGSQSSSSATENNTSWDIIFQQQIVFGNTIRLHFANLSASINTNLFKFSPAWVEFTSSRVHLNINVEAAYVRVCHVFCLGASSHLCSSQKRLISQAMEGLPSLKALCLQMLRSHF